MANATASISLVLGNLKYHKAEPCGSQGDVFCFGCFTGMRFSDIRSLEKENIHGGTIRYRVVKTNQNNTIPMNPYTEAIVDKNKKKDLIKLLPVISESKTNEYLKELFTLVKIKRKVQLTHFQGAKRIQEIQPLNEIVTFHMSKKTFMTNFLAKGGSLVTAMSITGNKDFKTAKRYYKVVDSLKAEEMAKVFGEVSINKIQKNSKKRVTLP